MLDHKPTTLATMSLGLILAISSCSERGATRDDAPTTTATTNQTSAVPAGSATPSDNSEMISKNMAAGMNWFGGPVYNGEPALDVTAALVQAGGGADNFSFEKALISMLGEKTTQAEVASLTQKYGADNVKNFVEGMDFAVKTALRRATEAGVKMPEPAKLQGPELAKALIHAGTAPDGAFWSGYLFDKALSHDLHNQVMGDIETQRSAGEDLNVHKILNQAMYDAAQALGLKDVKLASLN